MKNSHLRRITKETRNRFGQTKQYWVQWSPYRFAILSETLGILYFQMRSWRYRRPFSCAGSPPSSRTTSGISRCGLQFIAARHTAGLTGGSHRLTWAHLFFLYFTVVHHCILRRWGTCSHLRTNCEFYAVEEMELIVNKTIMAISRNNTFSCLDRCKCAYDSQLFWNNIPRGHSSACLPSVVKCFLC